jgi:Peptidase family M49
MPFIKKFAPENNAMTDSRMAKLNDFSLFRLTTDTGSLTKKEKQMIPLLIEAARLMDDIFWMEAWGDKNALLDSLKSDTDQKLAMIHYGPWERLSNNRPFLPGYGPKPPGANFYPPDMTVNEFKTLPLPEKTSLYTLLRRDAAGNLRVIPYHEAFKDQLAKASWLIRQASQLADDPGLKKYLSLRAEAVLSDDYYESDIAWMEMKTNTLDFVAGPIETYEDQLFGYKAAHEAYVLVKDKNWTSRLARYAALLPMLQQSLPVDAEYKKEMPGSESDLGVYDAIYYAGDCNAGSKTIAINLPNDEKVHLAKGSRRLQLKNSMQAKFDRILMPIAHLLICEDQVSHVTFDAFFSHTLLHEMAHGLGTIRNTITGRGTVREALKEKYTTLEEGKADILGLYLADRLTEMGERNADRMNEYTTFLASIFRSIRFGASSAHGKANLIFFTYFKEKGAFAAYDNGKFSVNPEAMKSAINSLSNLIITIQGDGDYEKAAALISHYSVMDEALKAALKKVEEKDIPVELVFEQGTEVLDLK